MRLCMTNKSLKVIYYLGEGETENQLKRSLNLRGNFQVFNIWEKDISRLIRSFERSSEIIIFVDADQCNVNGCIDRFTSNINCLISQKFIVRVLVQVNNLEDEIINGFVNSKTAFKVFNVRNKSELKRAITKVTNLERLLSGSSFDANRLWIKDHSVLDRICSSYRANHSQLIKNRFK